MVDVIIELTNIFSRPPQKMHDSDACFFDVFCNDSIVLQPQEIKKIPLGFKIQLPRGYEAQIRPRSGNTLNRRLHCFLGTIDEGYRGEVNAIIQNLSEVPQCIRHGERVAQMKISEVPRVLIKIGKVDPYSDRQDNGFGSTGN